MSPTQSHRATPNALAAEKSPYLRQHAWNPVDWRPWGVAALEEARRRDVPIFLSVGYAACHWCHVMERESFEDPAIAAVLNRDFIPVKVDREERPDIDEIYMTAVQRMTGHGGWPMSVFCTPDGRPFYGGTYFPPTPRHGRVSFPDLLAQLARAWQGRRDEVEQVADAIRGDLAEAARQRPIAGPSANPDPRDLLTAAVTELEQRFDPEYGGFGGAPKFPPHHALRLLCRAAHAGDVRAVPLLSITLDRMAQGGLFDHVGGGFHRYATDRVWLLPHFEKMLCDNALLARVYAEASVVLDNPAWARVARETCDWMLRDLLEPEGGFVAAWDADSEGEEGRYYVWSRTEAERIAGPEFCDRYGIAAGGNFHDEATGHRTGTNIPHLGTGPEAPRLPDGLPESDFAALAQLRAVRAHRIPPLRDHKVLTAWNGLAIGALAKCGQWLDEPKYVAAARDAARFCTTALCPDGAWMHRWAEGEAAIPAFLDDRAYLADGLIDLAEATGDSAWLATARTLAQGLLSDFQDPEDGGFYYTSERWHEPLVARSRDLFDGALPSANGVAVRAMARLGGTFADVARATIAAYHGVLARAPQGVPTLIDAACDAFAGDENPVRSTVCALVSVEGTPSAGQTLRARFRIEVAPGCTIESAHPDESWRIASCLGVDPRPEFVASEAHWPAPESRMIAGSPCRVHSGVLHVDIPLTLVDDLPGDGLACIARFTFQECTEDHCHAPASLAVPFHLSTNDTRVVPAA
ncbi:MAG: thioredoxin domain-containing protein [Armatimonadota bacterium]